MLEAIDRLDSAFAVTDPGVVNDRVEPAEAVGLIGKPTSLRDASEVADHHAARLGRRGPRVSGTTLVAGVKDYLVAGGKQSLSGRKTETVGRSRDQDLAHRPTITP